MCPFLRDRYLYQPPTSALPAQNLVGNPTHAYSGYTTYPQSPLCPIPSCCRSVLFHPRAVGHHGASSLCLYNSKLIHCQMIKYTTALSKESAPSPTGPTFEVWPW